MDYTKDEKTLLWLDGLGLDHTRRVKLLSLCAQPYALVQRFASYAAKAREIVGEEAFARMQASLSSPAFMRELLAGYEKKGIRAVTYFSAAYPDVLKQIPNPPLVLYCRGDVSLLQSRLFAIVGSRHTPPAVRKLTEKWAGELSRYFTVVSGCAPGPLLR